MAKLKKLYLDIVKITKKLKNNLQPTLFLFYYILIIIKRDAVHRLNGGG